MTADHWFVLSPVDVVSVRDGRAFSAGVDGFSNTVFPRPSTLAGAVGAAFGARPSEVVGPFTWTNGMLRLPAPLDMTGRRGTVRLVPEPLQRGEATDIQMEVLAAGTEEYHRRWVDADTLAVYLSGGEGIDGAHSPPFGLDEGRVFPMERRIGLVRNATGGAEPQYLYTAQFLRPAPRQVGFAVRVRWESAAPDPLPSVRFGGEGRFALVEPVGAPTLPPPSSEVGQDVLLYLATPSVFASGWRPPLPTGAQVVGGCVGGPEPVASWDTATDRGRPLAWAVSAGSVYYLRFENGSAAADYVGKSHGECLAQAEDWMRTAGFGLALTGRWN